MSNALEANTALISYLRFKRQWPYICTECGCPGDSKADVLASDGKSLMEFEVKISIADVRKDFEKVRKHELYKEAKPGTPNTLTYVVHESIAEKATEILPAEYGVISFRNFRFNTIKVIRKAKKLHDKPVTPVTLLKMAKRMSSEIANFHINLVIRSNSEIESSHIQILEACRVLEKHEIDSILDDQIDTPIL
jgi:hypothetical protein